jgi:uncharacterized small protein (DUF1192 family)
MDLAPLIPVVGILVLGLSIFTRSPLGRAMARRIEGAPSDEVRHQIAALSDEVARLGQELAETQERVDFAERLLARGKPGNLPAE